MRSKSGRSIGETVDIAVYVFLRFLPSRIFLWMASSGLRRCVESDICAIGYFASLGRVTHQTRLVTIETGVFDQIREIQRPLHVLPQTACHMFGGAVHEHSFEGLSYERPMLSEHLTITWVICPRRSLC